MSAGMTRAHADALNRSVTILIMMAGDKAQHQSFRKECKRDVARLAEVAAMIQAQIGADDDA